MKKDQIDRIIANLETITGSDLEALETQIASIVSDLKDIETYEQSDTDLDALETQAGGIVSDLNSIEDCELDLDEWETKTGSIVSNLKTIEHVDLDASEAQVDRVLAKLAKVIEVKSIASGIAPSDPI